MNFYHRSTLQMIILLLKLSIGKKETGILFSKIERKLDDNEFLASLGLV